MVETAYCNFINKCGQHKAGFILSSEQGENRTNNTHVTQLAFYHQDFTTFSSSHGEIAFVGITHLMTLTVGI